MTPSPIPDFERGVEAALFAATEPLSPVELSQRVGQGDVRGALDAIVQRHAGSGIELVERGGRWHFRPISRICCGANARSRAACRARRWRCWRSSPITNPSAGRR